LWTGRETFEVSRGAKKGQTSASAIREILPFDTFFTLFYADKAKGSHLAASILVDL
jgi:hypothetical protein